MERWSAVTGKTRNAFILFTLSSLWLTLKNSSLSITAALITCRCIRSTGFLQLSSLSNLFDKLTTPPPNLSSLKNLFRLSGVVQLGGDRQTRSSTLMRVNIRQGGQAIPFPSARILLFQRPVRSTDSPWMFPIVSQSPSPYPSVMIGGTASTDFRYSSHPAPPDRIGGTVHTRRPAGIPVL